MVTNHSSDTSKQTGEHLSPPFLFVIKSRTLTAMFWVNALSNLSLF